MTEKEALLSARAREHKRTLRVLRAIPAGSEAFKPHERSRSMAELASIFAMEETSNSIAAKSGVDFSKMAKPPMEIPAIIALYEKNRAESDAAIESVEERAFDAITKFGPWDMRRGEIFWDLLFDSIHHRGQMSVYIRLAGGKVPSIYGPSADDPGV